MRSTSRRDFLQVCGLALFERDQGKFFVSRVKWTGEPVDDLKKNPIEQSILVKLRKGKRLDSHMGNFFECVRDRSAPVSDVWSHHRALSTCHLANIAFRLGRDLKWDPVIEQIVGDAEANAWLGASKARDLRRCSDAHYYNALWFFGVIVGTVLILSGR